MTIQNGANLTVPAGFTNAGSLTVGFGSTLAPLGTYTQTGGTTQLLGGSINSATPVPPVGNALSFNGSSDYVSVADAPSLRPSNALTLEGWVNFSSVPTGPVQLFGKPVGGTSSEDSYVVWYQSGSLFGGIGTASTFSSIHSSWALTANTWYHIAYTDTVSGTTSSQALYINGQLVATGTANQSIGYDSHPLLLGTDYDTNALQYWFPGQITDFSLWNVARTQTQIQSDMNASPAGLSTQTGLVVYLPLNAGSGTTVTDLSGNGNNGTLGGGLAFQPSWVAIHASPPTSNALSFNGSSDYVSVADAPSLRPSNALTLEGWVNFSSVPTGPVQLFGKPVGGTSFEDSYVVWYQSGSLFGGIGTASTFSSIHSNWTPTANTWYHIAYTDTVSGTTSSQALYINGQLIATGTANQSIGYDSHPLLLGTDYDTNALQYWFPGQITDFSLWNVARTQTQIQSDMNASPAGLSTQTGLVVYLPLTAGSGTTVTDLSGNGNNGTFGGGLAFQPSWTSLPALSLTLTIQGGTLTGSGTINANVINAATVSPGGSNPGTLYITGSYTQTAAGTLDINVGAAASQLTIAGAAALGGTLNVGLTVGFSPTLTESFPFLTASTVLSRFTISTGLSPYFSLTYNATNVTLTPPQWTPIAPGSILNGQAAVTGRVTSVAVDPNDTTENTIYVTTADGGAWKTTNANAPSPIWMPLFDSTAAMFCGYILAVNVPGTTGTTLFLGTGEADNSPDSYYGTGVYESQDGGQTWSLVTGNQAPSPGLNAFTITNVTGNLGSPITITTTGNPFLSNGDQVTITGVAGDTAANGTWTIANLTATTFQLVSSTGISNGTYAGGGTGVISTPTPANPFAGKGISSMVYDPATGNLYVADSDGGSGLNEIQTLNPSGFFPGFQFTLTFNGQTTQPIIYTGVGAADAMNIQNALDALSTIGGVAGTMTVTPSQTGSFTVEFGGSLSLEALPLLTATVIIGPLNAISVQEQVQGSPLTVVNGTSGNPGVWRIQPGASGVAGAWVNLTDIVSFNRGFTRSSNPADPVYGPLSGSPSFPDTPGPDDNYQISFPQTNAAWTSLALVNGTLFAALDATSAPQNSGVFWTANPTSNQPIWDVGDPMNGFPPFAPDGEGPGEFPTGVMTGVNNGNIKISAAGNTLYAAVTDSAGELSGIYQGTFSSVPVPAVAWSPVNTPPLVNGEPYLQASGGGQEGGLYNNAILVNPANSNDIIVGGQVAINNGPGFSITYTPHGQIWESQDGGVTWTDISVDFTGNGPATNQHEFYLSGGNLYAASDGGLWELQNPFTPGLVPGAPPPPPLAWKDLNGSGTTGLDVTLVNSVAVNPNNPTNIVAGTQDTGIIQSTNNGAWQDVSNGVASVPVFPPFFFSPTDFLTGGAVQFDPQNPNRVYAVGFTAPSFSSEAYLLVSNQGGAAGSWTPVMNGTSPVTVPFVLGSTTAEKTDPSIFPLVVESNGPGISTLLVGGFNSPELQELQVSMNGSVLNTVPFVNIPISAVTAIAAATHQGTFQPDPAAPWVIDQGANALVPGTFYVTDGTNILATEDNGRTWSDASSNSLLSGLGGITQLVVDPRNSYTVYAVRDQFDGGQVWQSTNAGQTWTNISGNLPNMPAWSLAIDPSTGNLYVGTDEGVYESINGGSSWARFGIGLPNVQVKDLVLTQTTVQVLNQVETTTTLTAGTYGRGVYQFTLNAMPLSFTANNSQDLDNIVNAVNALPKQSIPVTILVQLGSGTYSDLTPKPPAGVTLVLSGQQGSTRFIGHSPALTITAAADGTTGTVIATGLTFTTATAAPTILVQGGNLVLRDDDVEESTGSAQAAIFLAGGTLDLGSPTDPGNDILNVNGTGQLVQNATPNPVPVIGDTFEVGGTPLAASLLSFTSLAVSTSNSVYGQTVTLTATVQASTTGEGTPTGSIDFVNSTTGADLGSVALSPQGVAVLTTTALIAGMDTVVATYSGDSNFTFSNDSATLAVSPAPLTITADSKSMVYGGTLPVLTASYSGFVNGDSAASLATLPTLSTTATAGSHVGAYAITASGASDPNYTISYISGTLSIAPAALTITANNASMVYGGALPTLTASYFGFVNGDTVASLTTRPTLNTTATATSLPGSYSVTANGAVDPNYTITYVSGSLTIQSGIYILNATASGALSLSGNAQLNIGGAVFVDSSSGKALQASGNAQVDASVTDVVGGDQVSGNASFNHQPVTHASVAADPLAGLAPPSTTGLTNWGSVNLGGNCSLTINPGIYSQISVSGNASLTLMPGIYIIAGGGISVSGDATVCGQGVLIYNAGSNVLGSGHSFGGLTVSGNAVINLSAASTGAYAGVVYFQSRDNTVADSISGNAVVNWNGVYYAPAAQLNLSGNDQFFQDALLVNTLLLSGNAQDDQFP